MKIQPPLFLHVILIAFYDIYFISISLFFQYYLYIHHHMSTDDIGLAYGIRGSTVAMYLREQGIEIRANTLDLDENKIKKLRAQGYGVARIAQAMGCSTSAVRKRLAMKKYISP